MTETTSKVFILIVVFAVILTAFLTWKVSEWQNEKIDSQNTNAAKYSIPNGNTGKVNINLVPIEINEVG
ncbi:TPA: hypothetical protein HA219_03825 [Candidatus Woesearchaeota archaeon]|nr:hypothetical protein [Candidatus Woesearchaeota archaeon]HIH39819.1 hypothetical protein [Candidatus Woesearchaeota archaeon]